MIFDSISFNIDLISVVSSLCIANIQLQSFKKMGR